MATNDEQLEQMFNCIDINQDGCISPGELQEALHKGQMHFDLATTTDLLQACTPDGSARVTRTNFDTFQQLLWQLLSQLRSLFGQFQCDSLSYPQVEQALGELGFRIDRTAMLAVHSRFDPLSIGAYDFCSFTDLVLFLRGAAAAFNTYDAKKDGIIKLSFHQYLHACSHTV